MKAIVGFLVVFILIGVVYGLAFVGIIPVAKIAGKSHAATSLLVALKLEKPHKNKAIRLTGAPIAPASVADPNADQKAALDAERDQLQQEKAMLDRRMQIARTSKPAALFVPTSDKMVDIYDTMKPDDLAHLFGKLSDASVADALSRMDEGKAGKVLVAMPVDRAAKITALMNRVASGAQPATGVAQEPLQSPTPSLATSVP